MLRFFMQGQPWLSPLYLVRSSARSSESVILDGDKRVTAYRFLRSDPDSSATPVLTGRSSREVGSVYSARDDGIAVGQVDRQSKSLQEAGRGHAELDHDFIRRRPPVREPGLREANQLVGLARNAGVSFRADLVTQLSAAI
ncbi:hypothetical protein ACFTWF_22780 [Rhodococcus sp. NPDC056960]|uniref:hypothetical protein n=1 Tax=Rhodococcus sp. NPDC056960 TaxID=3345982 RepID=UPI00363BF215